MTELLIGYARVSTNDQDLTAQKNALAARRGGDTLVVTKLNRLARSLRDARRYRTAFPGLRLVTPDASV